MSSGNWTNHPGPGPEAKAREQVRKAQRHELTARELRFVSEAWHRAENAKRAFESTVLRAADAGYSAQEIARSTGVTTMTIHRMIKKETK